MRKIRQKTKEGISLITLIISIVVIIILSTVTILTFLSNNPIEGAKKAAFTSEMSRLAEELNSYAATMFIKTEGKFDILKLKTDEEGNVSYTGNDSIEEKSIYDILPSLKESKYDGIVTIADGKITLSYNDIKDKKEYKWVDSVDSYINISGIKIRTADDLKKIGHDKDYPLNAYYELTGDIDLNCSYDNQWEPIMIEANKYFSGSFDGKGYTIKGLYINNSNRQQSLFGNVTSGRIKNLTVEGEIIVSGAKLPKAAGFVSNLGNKGIIENCINRVNITVTGEESYYVGGFVADCMSEASIINCENYGTISGTLAVGGIVGMFENATDVTISNCINYGSISGTKVIGGIAGNAPSKNNKGVIINKKIKISNCYNKGKIEGTVEFIGGIIGNTEFDIEDCKNLAEIKGTAGVGGIVGKIQGGKCISNSSNTGMITARGLLCGGIAGQVAGESLIRGCYNNADISNTGNHTAGIAGIITSSKIEDCYSIGKITSTANAVGGIVGTAQTNSTIKNCYSASNINATTSTKGSILGNNENGNSVTLENCYYLDTIGIGGVAGTDDENTKATLEDDMKKNSFANSLGGAFKYDSKKINGGYPLLSWQ